MKGEKMKNSLSLFTDSQLNLELEIRAEGEGGYIEGGLLDYSSDEISAELKRRKEKNGAIL